MTSAPRTVVAIALAVCAVLGTSAGPASAQRGDRDDQGRVDRPERLLEEYPFEQGRLRGADRSRPSPAPARSSRRGSAAEAGADDSWVLPAVILSAMALVFLGIAGRRLTRRPAEAPEPRSEPEPPPAPKPQRTGRFERARADPLAWTPLPGIHAVANQKGGVGKTTVSLVLGAAAVRRGSRVLLIDLDPQASATMVLGANDRHPTVADVLRDPAGCWLADAISSTEWGVDVAPAEWALRRADTGVLGGEGPVLARQHALADYDLVLIDCPPNLGALTIEALSAAARVVVVTEPTFLAIRALDELLNTLDYVTAEHNPSLELAGVVLNRVEGTAEHRRGVAEIEEKVGSRVWEPHIPKRAVLQDAMRVGVPPQDLRSHYAEEVSALFDDLVDRLRLSRAAS